MKLTELLNVTTMPLHGPRPLAPPPTTMPMALGSSTSETDDIIPRNGPPQSSPPRIGGRQPEQRARSNRDEFAASPRQPKQPVQAPIHYPSPQTAGDADAAVLQNRQAGTTRVPQREPPLENLAPRQEYQRPSLDVRTHDAPPRVQGLFADWSPDVQESHRPTAGQGLLASPGVAVGRTVVVPDFLSCHRLALPRRHCSDCFDRSEMFACQPCVVPLVAEFCTAGERGQMAPVQLKCPHSDAVCNGPIPPISSNHNYCPQSCYDFCPHSPRQIPCGVVHHLPYPPPLLPYNTFHHCSSAFPTGVNRQFNERLFTFPQQLVVEAHAVVNSPPHIPPGRSSIPLSSLVEIHRTRPLQTPALASAAVQSQDLTPSSFTLSTKDHSHCSVRAVRRRKGEHRPAAGIIGLGRNARKVIPLHRSRSVGATEPSLSVSVQSGALLAISTVAPEARPSPPVPKSTSIARPVASQDKSQCKSDQTQQTRHRSNTVPKRCRNTSSKLTGSFTESKKKGITSTILDRGLSNCEDPIYIGSRYEIDRSETPSFSLLKVPMPRKQPETSKISLCTKILPNGPGKQFPVVCTDFNGVPEGSVGDMLQIWDFMTAFGKILHTAPCGLLNFERALSSSCQEPIIDTLIIRLVYTILADKQLVEDLNFEPDLVMSLLSIKSSRRRSTIKEILCALPSILRVEMDASNYVDGKLADVVNVLVSSEETFAFYHCIGPAGRILILRHLVELACGADALRECVLDSLEHAAEERKKARDNAIAGRRKIETQLRDLRDELEAYKHLHNLETGSIEDGTKATVTGSTTNPPGDQSGFHRVADVSCEYERPQSHNSVAAKRSRKETLENDRRIREMEKERRSVERGAEALEAKIDKLKSTLKSMKTARVLSRDPSKSNESKSAQLVPGKNPASSALIAQVQLDLDSDPVRTFPLGHDRKRRSYWFLPDVGRLWIESTSLQSWCYLNDKVELNKLMEWLSPTRQVEAKLATKLTKFMPAIEAAITKSTRVRATPASLVGQKLVEGAHWEGDAGIPSDAGNASSSIAIELMNCMHMNAPMRARSSSLSSNSNKGHIDVQAASSRKSRSCASGLGRGRVMNDQQSEGDRGVPSEDNSVTLASSLKNCASIPSRRSLRRALASTDIPKLIDEHDHLVGSRTSSRSPREDAVTDTISAKDDLDCRRSARLSRAVSLKRSANALTDGGEVAVNRRTRSRSLTAMT